MAHSITAKILTLVALLVGVAHSGNRISLARSAGDRVEVRLQLDEPVAGFQFSVQHGSGVAVSDFQFGKDFRSASWMTGSNTPGDSVLTVLAMALSFSTSIQKGTWVLGSFRVDLPPSGADDQVALGLVRTTIADQYARELALEAEGLSYRISDPVVGSPPKIAFDVNAPYPNPFNPTTRLQFTLHQSALVSVAVYDIIGRVVAPLLDEQMAQGTHNVEWNGRDLSGNTLASGTYFFMVRVGEQMHVEKVALKK